MRILITKAGKIVLEDLEDLQESCPKTMNIIRHRNLTISHYDPMKNKRIPFQNNITISSLNDSNNLYNTTNIFQNRKKMMLNSDINTNNFIDNISNSNNNNNIEISEIKPLKLGKNKINFPKNFADKYENETNNSVGNIISSNENFIPFLSNSSNNNISSSNNNTLHSKLYSFKEIIPESSINTMKKLIINNRKEKEKHTRIDENNFRSSYEIQTDLEKFNDVINYPKINGNKTGLIKYLNIKKNINPNYLKEIVESDSIHIGRVNKMCKILFHSEEQSNLLNNIIKQKIKHKNNSIQRDSQIKLDQMKKDVENIKIKLDKYKHRVNDKEKYREMFNDMVLHYWSKYNFDKLNKKGMPKNKYMASFFDDSIKLNTSNDNMKNLPNISNK